MKCPVCNGNGLVSNGFYRQTSGHWSTSDASPETCKSCNGLGYIVHLPDKNILSELYTILAAIENREPNLSSGTIELIKNGIMKITDYQNALSLHIH